MNKVDQLENILREITPLSPEDSFLVFDRIKASFDFPYHYHPEVELNFVYGGKGYLRMVGDHTENIDDLELVLVGPNLPHCWANDKCKNKKTHEVTIQFSDDFFSHPLMDKNILKPINKLIHDSIRGILFSKETTEKLKEPLLKLAKMNGFESFVTIMNILNELAVSENKRYLSSYSIEAETFGEHDKMKIIHDYVHKNFENKIKLEDVASHANMSAVTFNRFIKKRTGKTFVNYLNEIRIGYATRWLMEKDFTISETAFKAGFNNLANFNKIFKSIKHTTPSEFKEKYLGVKRIE